MENQSRIADLIGLIESSLIRDLSSAMDFMYLERDLIKEIGKPYHEGGDNRSLLVRRDRLIEVADVLSRTGHSSIACNILRYGRIVNQCVFLTTAALTAWTRGVEDKRVFGARFTQAVQAPVSEVPTIPDGGHEANALGGASDSYVSGKGAEIQPDPVPDPVIDSLSSEPTAESGTVVSDRLQSVGVREEAPEAGKHPSRGQKKQK